MPEPRLSIIIPAYNAQRTLYDTLASLQQQTCGDWEACVVDDGSTDETSEVVARFVAQDDRIVGVRRSNGGEAAARNSGLAHAASDWVLFLTLTTGFTPATSQR